MRAGRKLVAVDFDSRQLRLVEAERHRSGARIVRLAGFPMPEGIDLTDAQAVGAFLGRTLREMRLSRARVLMNVPRGQSVLKPLTLPPGTHSDEIAGMVQYQVSGELPFRSEEAV
ncbi:MAG: pilus assembly protein PilM, partial [Planctomycetota bacterium]